ncbi:hypothetical protein H6P81_019160 [Aristolochia fimbriata]|uniref:cysteine-dependent adenosine diphosphate thiazole synthase n=1 Tax=Aristolochia fimbriata TaxID=158543 RepID=A0AAV7DQY8_ARIFI|nr:hypothetical protein H6P81_019160 [Aristolochia fimbriata]
MTVKGKGKVKICNKLAFRKMAEHALVEAPSSPNLMDANVPATIAQAPVSEDIQGNGIDRNGAVEEVIKVPEVGMMFKSYEEVRDFYNQYARCIGFGILKRSSRYGVDGKYNAFVLACVNEGKPRTTSNNPYRSRRSAKTNCKAKINVRLCDDGFFHLVNVALEHNHTVSPLKARSFRCKKNVRRQQKRSVEGSDEMEVHQNKASQTNSPTTTSLNSLPLTYVQPLHSYPNTNFSFPMPSSPKYDLHSFHFEPIKESIVSREMTRRYMMDIIAHADTDVVVVGAGSAGLSCAYELSKNPNVRIAIIEQSVSPGGSAWIGGQLFSAMVVRKPAHFFLNELNISYEEQDSYVVVKHAALFTSTIISKLLARPNVKLFNAVVVEDLIVNGGRVGGVVMNWAFASMNHEKQPCLNSNVMEAKVVISSCGFGGPFGATGVKRLKSMGMVSSVTEMKVLDMNSAEDAIVKHTKEIVPGMIVTGKEVTEIGGAPRLGPIFGAMMVSGQKAAHLALKALGLPNALDGSCNF